MKMRLPASIIAMSIELYPHQIEAVNKLKSGAILCGGVGTGKSRTALAYYFFKECHGDINPHPHMDRPRDLYIITTAKKRDTFEWDGECCYFLLSDEDNPYGVRVIIDSWNNIKKYQNVYGAFFIFDEQRVVGRGAWVKAFWKIARKNKWILLSATPGDTWSDYVPVFVANGFYRNPTDFNSQHAVFNRFSKYPKIEKYINTGILIKHRNDILVNMPYQKSTIKHYITIISDYDKHLYNRIFKDRWDIYENKPIKEAGNLCHLLRRVVNSDMSRIEHIKELLETHGKVIIFYNFNYELDLLRELCLDVGIEEREWNGHKHEEIPKGDRWVYLVQYSAGSEGWNCTDTNVIIFYSQNYSYRTTIQAEGRIDRINTPYTDLYYYYIKSSSPIDMAIARALSKKKNFNERNFLGV